MAANIEAILSRLSAEVGLELLIIPLIIIAVLAHLWGTRTNRGIAKGWMTAHAKLLKQEYAQVGFRGRTGLGPSIEEVESMGLPQAMSAAASSAELEERDDDDYNGHLLLQEKSADEFLSYATGRQNVAFTDLKLSLYRRYNPLAWLGEQAMAVFFESFAASMERLEATTYPFDGREPELVPRRAGKRGQESSTTEQQQPRRGLASSTYDGFVWAIVHKDAMKRLRDERYDLSLTVTRDHSRLPTWTSVMSENTEITDAMLSDALIEAVHAAGDSFESLIVTDQPLERPTKLQDTTPKKRIDMSLRLASSSTHSYQNTKPIFSYFLRLPDHLVATAHLRPEVMRKIRQTRDDQIQRLQRAQQGEKEEERALKRDKEKKEKREATLKGLSADEQRKYLEREREKGMRKSQKKMTQRA